jgi:hypothetical protein
MAAFPASSSRGSMCAGRPPHKQEMSETMCPEQAQAENQFFFFCLNTKNLQDSLQRFMLADLCSGKNQPWGVVEKGFMCLSIRRKKSLLMAAGRIQASRPPGLRAL